ncbi:MAG: carbamoyltransferase HypF [Thermodesulfovibrionales bacterium]|nr:carbamoyltransferase HypF [Thermodesulfovibrionales bacterium]
MKRCFEIEISGVVQGVGFRPFIYNLAKSRGYKGIIRNTSYGVLIQIDCEDPSSFISCVKNNHPSLAKIDTIDVKETEIKGFSDFFILDSIDHIGFTQLPSDISVCNECLSELINPFDRRFLYPFINCINCGPRYSIIKRVPYDRSNTTMAVFQMCEDCLEEYNDPNNRRFHAQANACHKCGPKLSLIIDGVKYLGTVEKLLEKTTNLLLEGAIVAIKGIGGFHLACDARNERTIKKLRQRKKRANKPFALMAFDVETVSKYCEISSFERDLLEGRRKPIVLLQKKRQINLPDDIAPNSRYLGFMLPYTPLHYLLFFYPRLIDSFSDDGGISVLVMTSGNFSEEPILIDNDEALKILSKIADAFLIHNRDIFMRVDDTVVKTNNSKLTFIRLSRGYVPQSINFKMKGSDVVGIGADIKNTFTVVKDGQAIISQHIGDFENVETIKFFEETFSNICSVYRVSPRAVAHDLHPAYYSRKWAIEYSKERDIRSYGIQHHYAHIASVMAENGLTEKIIGVALDGSGYGIDGKLWGSEFLICDIDGFTRFAHFRYIPLPGGEEAVRECSRCAISYLKDSYNYLGMDDNYLMETLCEIGLIDELSPKKVENLLKIFNNTKFSPLSSGAGRLFDAVSALIGLVYLNTFEGESAAALESLIDGKERFKEGYTYPYGIEGRDPFIINFSKMIKAIVEDIRLQESKVNISLKLHNTIIEVIRDIAHLIKKETGLKKIALSGGVFQNKYISENVYNELIKDGFETFFNVMVPCNDGGISLGQAYLLTYRLQK